MVKDIHGVDIANKCIRISEILFNKSNEELNIEDISMLLGYLPCIEVKEGEKFIEILKIIKLFLRIEKQENLFQKYFFNW